MRQTWSADKVGPVKIETSRRGKEKGLAVLELKSYEPGKADNPQ